MNEPVQVFEGNGPLPVFFEFHCKRLEIGTLNIVERVGYSCTLLILYNVYEKTRKILTELEDVVSLARQVSFQRPVEMQIHHVDEDKNELTMTTFNKVLEKVSYRTGNDTFEILVQIGDEQYFRDAMNRALGT
jgi:hypothetical protein